MLDTIASSEGAGYRTLVGGRAFNSDIQDLGAHPNLVGLRTKDGPSTAAGRYQITSTTWKGLQKKLGLTDFGPESQDRAAIELLRQRGALQDVLDGNFEAAARKLGNEWQSLPSGTSPNQGKHSWSEFRATIDAAVKAHQLPDDKSNQAPGAGAGAGRGSAAAFEPLRVDVVHVDSMGQQVRPSETLQTKIKPANPNTYTQHGASGSW